MQFFKNNINVSASDVVIGTLKDKKGNDLQIMSKKAKTVKRNKSIESVDHPGTIIVELTGGYTCICDAADWVWLRHFKWMGMTSKTMSQNVYAVTSVRLSNGEKKIIGMANMIRDNVPDGHVVDHDNQNSLDNRRKNLIIRSRSRNRLNSSKLNKNNKSAGARNIHKVGNYFRVAVRIDGHNFYKDGFKTVEAAIDFRDNVFPMLLGKELAKAKGVK